jgi:hypothetical protein
MIDHATKTVNAPVRRCVEGVLRVPTIPDP